MPGKARNGERDDMDAAANGRDDMSNEHLLVELIRQAMDGLAEDKRDLADHKRECVEERREAKRERHDFRTEVALGFNGLREEMRASFDKINASIFKIQERVEAVSDRGHERESETWDWRLKAAMAVIVVLVSITGFALFQLLKAGGIVQ